MLPNQPEAKRLKTSPFHVEKLTCQQTKQYKLCGNCLGVYCAFPGKSGHKRSSLLQTTSPYEKTESLSAIMSMGKKTFCYSVHTF